MKNSGMLCIISAPSGTGKSTLIKALIQNDNFLNNVKLSISYTTRLKRPGEVHGKEYYFISVKKFESMINANLFFEYAKVFNHYYGTKKSDIAALLETGAHVILDVDWNGVRTIRNKMSNIYTVFVLPPSRKELKLRLRHRGQDTEKIIAFRMKNAIKLMYHLSEYNFIIINDNLNIARKQLQSIILSQQLQYMYQKIRYNDLINNLFISYDKNL